MKEQFAKSVCLFLAEMLRTRKVTLHRGAEIARAMVLKLDEIETEEDFLRLTRELEYEFQELVALSHDLVFHQEVSRRQQMEQLVRAFVIHDLPGNPRQAVLIMEKALEPACSLEELATLFPDFAEFVAIEKLT